MCAGDELEFLLTCRVTALFGRALRSAREDAARPLSLGDGAAASDRSSLDSTRPHR
jgi:hypothetical protein